MTAPDTDIVALTATTHTATQNTTALTNAITTATTNLGAGTGDPITIWIPQGVAIQVNSRLPELPQGVTVQGSDGGTTLQIADDWDGSSFLFHTRASYVTIRNLRVVGGSTTDRDTAYNNPKLDALIRADSASNLTVENVFASYVQGWLIDINSASAAFDATSDLVTFVVPHGYKMGDIISFPNTPTGSGVSPLTAYYVRTVPSPTTLTLSTTYPSMTDLDITASGTVTYNASAYASIRDIRGTYNAAGIRITSDSVAKIGQHIMSGINLQGIGCPQLNGANVTAGYGDGGGDVVLITDTNDVAVDGMNAACFGQVAPGAAGSGIGNRVLHFVGGCNGLHFQNIDIGAYPTSEGMTFAPSPGPIVHLEARGTGVPKAVNIINGVLQGGEQLVKIDAGEIELGSLQFSRSGSRSILAGSAATGLSVHACTFYPNNGLSNVGTPAYEVEITGTMSARIGSDNNFRSVIGNAISQVRGLFKINTSPNNTEVVHNRMTEVVGLTPANVLASGSGSYPPNVVTANTGLNPPPDVVTRYTASTTVTVPFTTQCHARIVGAGAGGGGGGSTTSSVIQYGGGGGGSGDVYDVDFPVTPGGTLTLTVGTGGAGGAGTSGGNSAGGDGAVGFGTLLPDSSISDGTTTWYGRGGGRGKGSASAGTTGSTTIANGGLHGAGGAQSTIAGIPGNGNPSGSGVVIAAAPLGVVIGGAAALNSTTTLGGGGGGARTTLGGPAAPGALSTTTTGTDGTAAGQPGCGGGGGGGGTNNGHGGAGGAGHDGFIELSWS